MSQRPRRRLPASPPDTMLVDKATGEITLFEAQDSSHPDLNVRNQLRLFRNQIDRTRRTADVDQRQQLYVESVRRAFRLASTTQAADLIVRMTGQTIRVHGGKEPPARATFLLLLLPLRHRDELIGDLLEKYRTVVLPKYGSRPAAFWYWTQVLFEVVSALWHTVQKVAGLDLLLRGLNK